MPTAITPKEGQQVVGNLIFKNADVNRGTTLELGLFTNTTHLTETSVLADVTEPTGGSYARISLTDASWSVDTDGLCTYAKQTFNATGSAYSDDITGFFIATTGTSAKLLRFQIEDVAVQIAENESYSVTPSIDIGTTSA
jgi:hypothetical protein